ncbi:hypothetical protein [Polaribacter sp. HaHaR_3_91]|uniref:hypothetical protein n=1 Tax=Polaribacter sp. HaHaR_3_91 TaxID=2745561 RepID=UPI001C4F3DA6|nr:hypothetical protein [Polaribacter sp. HaHaR_3_91]QXP65177.1 hypothetical protein H0I27_08380 [Polaribacter sp. HaHaR_3_91]
MKNTIPRILNKLTNSCKKTVELIDKKTFSKLSVIEKTKLKLHKSICKTCKAYEEQSKFLDQAVVKLYNQKQPHNKVQLSADRKSKILEKIKKQ